MSMALKVARRGKIPPFIVMDVLRAAAERAAAGKDVIHLEVGQPSTPAPRKVIEAAHVALESDTLGYTLGLGVKPLRKRIAEQYRDAYGVAVEIDRVVVTVGSSGAFLLAFLCAFDPGDRVGIAAPGYPCYRNILTAVGCEPVAIPIGPSTRFQLTVDSLAGLEGRLDGLIVASPSNPTGGMLAPTELAALVDWCRRHGVRLISDEIYHGITYGAKASTAAAFPETIAVNSFSKYYSMTGWRLGWMLAPPELLRPLERLATNLFISPPSLSQRAAVAAFDATEELEGNVARYARNRELLLDGLPRAGFDAIAPSQGAFYLYLDVSRYTNDSDSYCKRMLAETGIACTPGVDFDTVEGARYLRFAYPGSTADMEEALRRLTAWSK